MTRIDGLLTKFYKKPVPRDITYQELWRLAKYFGCEVLAGGKHSKKIVHKPSGTVIPIPVHGKNVKHVYVSQAKVLFDTIREEKK